MREIKFRGKDENSGKWVYGVYCQDSILGILTHVIQTKDNIGKDTYDEYCIDINTLGQYIGREDHNNTPIYEGDIVKVSAQYGNLEFVGVVKFGNCSFYVESELIHGYRWQDYDVLILGNIYDKEKGE